MKDGDLRHIYKNDLDMACFSHDLSYGTYKDLTNRTVSDKVLMQRAHNISQDKTLGRWQRSLAEMVYLFFKRKSSS